MLATTLQRECCVEWSVVSRPFPGQAVSGDLHVVLPWEDGVLLGVIDGLGHGEEATRAAHAAADTLARHAREPVTVLMQLCHRALQATRGAVMTLMAIDARTHTAVALGVGNVETLVFRADPKVQPQRESVLLRSGVVGYRLPALQASAFPLGAGDIVVFATDGVREDFGDKLELAESLPRLVAGIVARSERGTDDALVLGVKYLGQP